jgi:hypothetical protein
MSVGLYKSRLTSCGKQSCIMCATLYDAFDLFVAELYAYKCGYWSLSAKKMNFENAFHGTVLYLDPPSAQTDEGGFRICGYYE